MCVGGGDEGGGRRGVGGDEWKGKEREACCILLFIYTDSVVVLCVLCLISLIYISDFILTKTFWDKL